MQSIEDLAVQTYKKNLQYFSAKQSELLKMLNVLDKAIQNGDFTPRYDLEYINGCFDVKELQSEHYLYSGDSEHISKEFSKRVNFNKADYSFEGLPVYHSAKIIENNESDKARGMEGIYPIMDYYMENTKEDDAMTKIEKFIFVGVGLGLHIPIIASKVNAKEYLIIEDDLELFRLSLFTTKYFELAEKAELTFAVATDDILFLKAMAPFLDNSFFENRYLKYAHFLTHSKNKLKQIQHSILSQNFITFQYKTELEKFLRPLEYMNDDYNLINLGRHVKNLVFYNQPVLLVTAGPSLQKNIEWLKKNHEKFIIIAVSATLNTLYKHNIVPDIVTHLDGYEASLTHYQGFPVKDFLKETLFIFGPFTQPLVKYLFPKEHIFYYEEDTHYVNGFGSVSAPCIGSFSLLLGLILNAKDLYLLGLDFAVNQKTGATHSSEHAYSKETDMSNKDKVSSEMSLRENLFPVKGNFADTVHTNTLFNFSIQSLHSIIPKVKRDDQRVYNFNDGAYINATEPTDIEKVNVESFKTLDKSTLRKTIESILKDNSIKKLDQKDSESMIKRLEYSTEIAKFLDKYAHSLSRTNVDKYLYDLLGLASEILRKRTRETNNIVQVYYTFFRHVLPVVVDFFNTQGMKNKKHHIKKLDEMIQREMMNIEGIYTKTLKDFVSGKAVGNKAHEYEFMATLYDEIDEERLKNSYCKNAIGFLAVEENLNDKDFIDYIKELYVRFPQITFKALYFSDEQKNIIEKVEGIEIEAIFLTNIYQAAQEIELFLYNAKGACERAIYVSLLKYSMKVACLDVTHITGSVEEIDLKNQTNAIFTNHKKFEISEDILKKYEFSYTKIVYERILHEISSTDYSVDLLSKSFYRFDRIELILNVNQFKDMLIKLFLSKLLDEK
jgi:hypothetical protein